MPAKKTPFGGVTFSAALPFTTGTYFWVHSGTGSNGNTGLRPEYPVATVDYAIGKCTAGKGDVIVVLPGHAEAVTSTSIAHDISNVSVVGLGQGASRPTFTYGAAASTITVSAAGGSWRNCHFIGNFDNVAAAFTLGAAKDFVLDSCSFIDNSDALHFLSIVVTGATANAADGLVVNNCNWHGLAIAPNAFVSILGHTNRLVVSNNFVDMAATNNVGHFLTVAALVILNAQIFNNRVHCVAATNQTVGLFMTGSSTTNTGMVYGNFMSTLDTSAAIFITATLGLAVHQNYLSGVIAGSGTLSPDADDPEG